MTCRGAAACAEEDHAGGPQVLAEPWAALVQVSSGSYYFGNIDLPLAAQLPIL